MSVGEAYNNIHYTFVNPNTNESIVALLKQMVISKLLQLHNDVQLKIEDSVSGTPAE